MNQTHITTPWLSPNRAAEYLGISPRTLKTHRTDHTGPKVSRAGSKLIRYHRDDLDAWMQRK